MLLSSVRDFENNYETKHKKMSKGITLTAEEVKKLKEVLEGLEGLDGVEG